MAFLTAYLDSPTLIKAYVDKSFSYAALEHIKIFKGYEEINKRIINLEDYDHTYKITYEVEAIDYRLSYLLTLNEMSTRVVYRHIASSLPLPDLSTLGPQYSKEKTTFRILAFDAIKVKLFDLRNNMAVNMPKVEENVYELEIKGDLEGFEKCMERQRDMARSARNVEESMHNQSKDLLESINLMHRVDKL